MKNKIRNGLWYSPASDMIVVIIKASDGFYDYWNLLGHFLVWQERIEEIISDMDYVGAL